MTSNLAISQVFSSLAASGSLNDGMSLAFTTAIVLGGLALLTQAMYAFFSFLLALFLSKKWVGGHLSLGLVYAV